MNNFLKDILNKLNDALDSDKTDAEQSYFRYYLGSKIGSRYGFIILQNPDNMHNIKGEYGKTFNQS